MFSGRWLEIVKENPPTDMSHDDSIIVMSRYKRIIRQSGSILDMQHLKFRAVLKCLSQVLGDDI
jgi:hypothetical protein